MEFALSPFSFAFIITSDIFNMYLIGIYYVYKYVFIASEILVKTKYYKLGRKWGAILILKKKKYF